MSLVSKIKLAFLMILILISGLLIYINKKEVKDGVLTVAFLNIGQGDAIFIESPIGRQVLLDGGPSRSILREISKITPFYDRSIDVMIASHPDTDHIAGLNDILERYKIDLFMEPGVEGDTSIYEELNTRIERLKIKKLEARRGMVVDLGGGAIMEILFPVTDPRGMETNTASIVARLVYGENEFLLTGDSPKNIEEYLVSLECERCPLTLKADVLKAGHHGSKTSTSDSFVQTVSPDFAVISAGKDNRYGHPHQEVLNILAKNKVKILRTDRDGRIIFESDGVGLKIK
jgi:competence protein ComEC